MRLLVGAVLVFTAAGSQIPSWQRAILIAVGLIVLLLKPEPANG